jgi:outer membrane protein OmpA-like peptidoglycan-associated protein/Tol biopolymer transport system component
MKFLNFKGFPFLIFLVFLVLFCYASDSAAQTGRELTTGNTRAKRAFENAVQQYNMRNIPAAEKEFLEAVRFDPNFIEAYIVMGEMFQTNNDHRKAIEAFRKAVDINPGFFPNVVYYLAQSHLVVGQYDKALKNGQRFLEMPGISENMHIAALDLIERAEFAVNALANPVPFKPINLGPNINSKHEEYAPTLTADEQTLIFTRKKPREDSQYMQFGSEYEDFYISRKINGEWGPAENLGPPINTPRNEGAQSISADGMHLYFTACNRPDGMGSCDIYYARRMGDNWSEPVNLGAPVNTSAWDSQPSISPDGRTLYFVSARRGNLGRMDIWMTVRGADGKWSEPENLGPTINTTGREMSPFIHPDNQTLFFASDGHSGMGGMDLFYSVKQPDGQWSKPVNLGYPINTQADEISLVVGASGREAYFASEQVGGEGGSDIYFFELYEEARPAQVTYMKGFVFDADTRRRLRADFELIDLQSGDILVQSVSNERTGEFLVPIPVGKNLGLNVARDGYLFFSENFAYSDVRTGVDPHLYDIPLQPIREGESVVLRNIFFHTASHKLMPESVTELDRLIRLLNQNPVLKIEISGHTDNVGTFDYNKTLSENRALSVLNYLTENGIEKSRLKYAGYADTRPVATNDTEEGRALNRRTEFKVLGNN